MLSELRSSAKNGNSSGDSRQREPTEQVQKVGEGHKKATSRHGGREGGREALRGRLAVYTKVRVFSPN